MEVAKLLGLPLADGLEAVIDLPHTITYAILHHQQLQSYNELPKDKRPPRGLWDKTYALEEFFDRVWDVKGAGNKNTVEFNLEDVE